MQADTRTIHDRLRVQAESLRRKPTPLADLIPLLQEAADALDRSTVRSSVDAKAWAHAEDPARVISAAQKMQAERDGGASASSVRNYSVPLVAASAQEAVPQRGEWISVKERLPQCDGEAIFIGVNVAGFAGAFNQIAHGPNQVDCLYETAEETIDVMDCLERWMPLPASLQQHDQQEGA